LLPINSSLRETGPLLREAIERRLRIDAARGTTGGDVSLYRDFIRQIASREVALQAAFLIGFQERSDFALVWLETAGRDAAAWGVPRLAGDPKFLAKLDEAEKRRFLRLWYERGERAALFEFIAAHPEWTAAAWPVRMRQLIDAGSFEEAVKSVAQHHKISLELPPAGSGGAGGAVDEANPAAAFDAYWRRGNVVAARRVLDEARRGKGSSDREIWRLSAALAARDAQWQAAWQHLERCLEHSGLDSLR
jgi:hypothetical protein